MESKIKSYTSQELNILWDIMEEGVICMKFIKSDVKITRTNKKFRKIIGYTEDELVGIGLETLHDWVEQEDISKFEDIIYPPNNEPEPVRMIRMRNRKDRIITLAMRSTEGYDENGDPILVIVVQNFSDRISFFDSLPFSLVEFVVTKSRAHHAKVKRYVYSENTDIEEFSNLINWTVTYANLDATNSGIVDAKTIGQRGFNHHLKKDQIYLLTDVIFNLMKGIEVNKKEYPINNKHGVKLIMEGMLFLTMDSILISSSSLLARFVFVNKGNIHKDRIDFLHSLLEQEKRKSR